MDEIPFITIGNDELEDSPSVGDVVVCPNCGELHEVRYADEITSTLLAFTRCPQNKITYLVGINGKLLKGRTE